MFIQLILAITFFLFLISTNCVVLELCQFLKKVLSLCDKQCCVYINGDLEIHWIPLYRIFTMGVYTLN